MSAQEPLPGAPAAPGASVPVGGRGAEASEPAPEELREQLEREMEVCEWIMLKLDRLHKYVYPNSVYYSYVHYALREYKDLAFSDFDEVNVESIRRVIDACNPTVKLLDFAPDLREVIGRWKKIAARRGHEEIKVLMERLENMTLGEFLSSWEEVMERLEEHEYYELEHELYDWTDYRGRLASVLEEEIKNIAVKKGMTEEQAEAIIECLVEC